ncbi:DUF6798 domain-containing protein [Lyngbya sp. CCY1209]|uniref:DUF6798 domain-containing protein n=1 Tax=Lyngbya sp. CCY1209 TaxID=2886103 RepID=UPI002D1FD86B|nr:DUF6798 domain-containing protein [Lyngbya sp. CCY1209]MEB3885122.1 hypothetical protein [Lyngbya sp. CCY1209]
MKAAVKPLRSGFDSIVEILILGFVFGISYVQDPLYTSNQNTKFLHGMARAGYGYLQNDWQANTLNPLPVFTALVEFTVSHLHPAFFYVYYLILFGIYAYSLMGIASMIFKIDTKFKKSVYFLFLIAVHCVEIDMFALETHVHLHYGLAEQYILGSYFQTSNFGVFILLSIYLFLRGDHFGSILPLAIAATVHPAYLPSVPLITLGYMVVLYRQKEKLLSILSLGILSALLILPVTLYMTVMFQPTSPEIASLARRLIVHRIPHHSFPELWLDSVAWVQILVMVAGIYFVRKSPLFWIMSVAFIIASTLTAVQVISDSKTLAFMTPWRVSAWLVPLSMAMIVADLITVVLQRYPQFFVALKQPIYWMTLTTISIFFVVGVQEQIKELNRTPDYQPMMAFVKNNRKADHLYLIPHISGNFVSFRLETGVPILVNYKTHPYKDREVVEWHDRMMMSQRFYAPEFRDTRCRGLREIVETYGITHVITELGDAIACGQTREIYGDPKFKIYEILGNKTG